MQKLIALVLVIVGLVFVVKKFSPSQKAVDVSFEGEWVQIDEDLMYGQGKTKQLIVAVDKERFRIESNFKDERQNQYHTIEVYDGQMMHHKSRTEWGPGSSEAREGMPTEPELSSYKPPQADLFDRRFWSQSHIGKAGPGGKVAGRDTVLYQARENRPEGELTSQAWVDEETGVVLKSIQSVYSKQIEDIVTKTTLECRRVSFGPVDESFFSKP